MQHKTLDTDVASRAGPPILSGGGEDVFRIFAQTLPNHVWTAPPDGLLDWFNDRVYEYSGASAGELDGIGWTKLVHPDDLSLAGQNWQAALSSGDIYEMEFRLRRADGEYRWHLARAVPIRSASTAITRWVGTNTDIHRRKLAEDAYARDRNRIWALSQEFMMVCDFDGVISAVNPSATRILGWTEAEMTGQLLQSFVHEDDREKTALEVAKLAQGQTSVRFENRYRAKDGTTRLLDWTAVPDRGFIHGVARDVTRERDTENALRQSQKMEAIGQLTGGIAHDFNNLLAAIGGSVEVVKRLLAAGRKDEVDRFIAAALTSTQRAAALTHRLLAFSRMQSLDAKPLNVTQLVSGMGELLHRTLGESIELRTAYEPGLWPAMSDANQLENAILNLAINARDAMPRGGLLTIESRNTQLDAAYAAANADVAPGDYVIISVSDTGTGMSPEVVAKAFDPFFTTKPIGEGTGLGLSMIYGFAKQSAGHARIYSEIGRGTTVNLYLPRATIPASPIHSSAPDSLARGRGECVLVVEDESNVRQLILEVLKDLGYRFLEAPDARTAIPILESATAIDLLVTDVGLPHMNGRQLAEIARARRPGLKVLFITGYAENAAVRGGFLGHDMEMLTKPFPLDSLAAKLRSMLDR